MDKIKYILENWYDGNKARMLRIVSDGLVKAKKENNICLVTKIEKDLILIRSL